MFSVPITARSGTDWCEVCLFSIAGAGWSGLHLCRMSGQRRVRYLLECLVQAGVGCSCLELQVLVDVWRAMPIGCSAPMKDSRGSVMCGVPI